MPEKENKLKQPRNIFEAINQNVLITNENLLMALERITKIEQEVIALSLMFKAPEQPNAHGDDGAEGVSSEQSKK